MVLQCNLMLKQRNNCICKTNNKFLRDITILKKKIFLKVILERVEEERNEINNPS